MTSKKRKYGDLSARPLPSEDPSLIDDVFAAFTGARPSNVPAGELEAVEEEVSGRGSTTPARRAAPAQHAAVAGYTRVSNDLLDRIIPTLDTYDQAVLIRLYRLSRGFNSDTC